MERPSHWEARRQPCHDYDEKLVFSAQNIPLQASYHLGLLFIQTFETARNARHSRKNFSNSGKSTCAVISNVIGVAATIRLRRIT